MKKWTIPILCVLICLCFAGCGKEDIPQLLIDDTPAVALAMYDPQKVSNEESAEMVEEVNTQYPFSVPSNYRHLQDYVFAELNDNSEIIGFKIAVQQSDKSWKWEDCDAEGNIIEETTSSETETTSNASKSSSDSNSQSEKKNNSSSSSSKETTTKKSSSSSSSGSSTKEPAQSSSGSSSSSSSKPSVTSPPKQQAFTWKTISQSSCPISVSNTFDKYILKKDAATATASSNGSTYALIKAPTGQGVKVSSVTEGGKITYSYTSSGSNYVIVSINRDISVSFVKK